MLGRGQNIPLMHSGCSSHLLIYSVLLKSLVMLVIKWWQLCLFVLVFLLSLHTQTKAEKILCLNALFKDSL